MLTNVYVDGFNLYYGCLKGTPYKWLDLGMLCQALLPPNKIQRIRYFTAKVSAQADPHQPVRQSTYLRALQTVPGLSVHLGHFLTSSTRMPLANPIPGGPRTVEVIKTEEKGSDVNLATYLLTDAFRADADTFVLISNDSDLMEPIRLVRQELGYRVGIVNPHQVISRALQRTQPSFTKQIRQGVLAASQFPAKLSDAHGTITKPATW
ncbi:MAG: NYN domain-containing protein [Pseudonocardiaceae bacterium]